MTKQVSKRSVASAGLSRDLLSLTHTYMYSIQHITNTCATSPPKWVACVAAVIRARDCVNRHTAYRTLVLHLLLTIRQLSDTKLTITSFLVEELYLDIDIVMLQHRTNIFFSEQLIKEMRP